MEQELRRYMEIQARLQMMAFQELYNAVMMGNIQLPPEELEALTQFNLAAQQHYDNLDAIIDDILSDPSRLPLMQAAMGDMLDKDYGPGR